MFDEDEEWGRLKMGWFSDADEKLVNYIMGKKFMSSTCTALQRRYKPPARKTNQSCMPSNVVHNRVHTVANGMSYAIKPEVLVKAVSTSKTISGTFSTAKYISRTRLEDMQKGQYGSIIMHDEFGRRLTPQEIQRILQDWDLLKDSDNLSVGARRFKAQSNLKSLRRMTEEDKCHYVQSHHFVLSIQEDGDDPDHVQRFRAAVDATIKRMFTRKGFRCVWGVHDRHTDNLHAHIVVKAVPAFGDRLHNDRTGHFLDEFRLIFAQCLRNVGLEYVATRREDRRPLLHAIMAGQEPLRLNREVWQSGYERALYTDDIQNRGDEMRKLRASIHQATYGLGKVDKIVTAAAMLREAFDTKPHTAFWKALSQKFSSNRIPPEYVEIVDLVSNAFHYPVQAIAQWQRMAAVNGHINDNGKITWPHRSRATWELLKRPYLFGDVTSRCHELQTNKRLNQYLKNVPLPHQLIGAVDNMAAVHVPLPHAAIHKNRRSAILSLEKLRNEAARTTPHGWAPGVIQKAIDDAKRAALKPPRISVPEGAIPTGRMNTSAKDRHDDQNQNSPPKLAQEKRSARLKKPPTPTQEANPPAPQKRSSIKRGAGR